MKKPHSLNIAFYKESINTDKTIKVFYNLYFTDVLELSLAMTSIVLSATKIWDAINDPLMGMIVDKTHTKMGKCRPYVFWMSFPVIIVTALLFAPVSLGQRGNFIYAIIAYLLYYTEVRTGEIKLLTRFCHLH